MVREERIASNAKVPEGVWTLVTDQCSWYSSAMHSVTIYDAKEWMKGIGWDDIYFKYTKYNLKYIWEFDRYLLPKGLW